MENEYLDRIEIVLVETQDAANIGSVCRAMKTMGITHLCLVTNEEYDENRVRTLALHASDIWEKRRVVRSLSQALSDSVFSVASTRRKGKFRKLSSYTPSDLAKRLQTCANGKVSIVFGREADGLRDDEVNLCSSVVTIPTSELFPSLNLAQAVQIVTYNLFLESKVYKPGLVSVSHERVNEVTRYISNSLENIGYYKWDEEKKWTEILIRDTLEKATLSESEIKRFLKIFEKMEKIKIYKDRDNEKIQELS